MTDLMKRFPKLTAREASVAACVAAGLSNGETAAHLGVRLQTVKNILASRLPLLMGYEGGGSSRVRLTRVVLGFAPTGDLP